MTWSKIDDQARKHPKCRRAGNFATLLWRCSIDWSNQYHTDGFVPADEVRDLTPVPLSQKQADELAKRLVECRIRRDGQGLWEIAEGGFLIHDFAEFNPSSSEEEDRRRSDRERKRAERERLARKRLSNGTAQTTPADTLRPAGQASDVQPDRPRTSEWTSAGCPDARPNGVRSPRAGAGARAGTRDPVPSRPVPSKEAEAAAAADPILSAVRLALNHEAFSDIDIDAVARDRASHFRELQISTIGAITLEVFLNAIREAAADSTGTGENAATKVSRIRRFTHKPRVIKPVASTSVSSGLEEWQPPKYDKPGDPPIPRIVRQG